jgi:hypothetical protein
MQGVSPRRDDKLLSAVLRHLGKAYMDDEKCVVPKIL